LSVKYPQSALSSALLFVDHAVTVVATTLFDGNHHTPGVGLLVMVGGEIHPSQDTLAMVVELTHETINDDLVNNDELMV
jgi:hypothetical protein